MRSVRPVIAAFALGAAAVSPATGAGAVQAGFSDVICPEATHYVLAVGRVRTDDAPQRVYDAAQAAVDAYSRCSRDKLAYGYREAQHYADTRGAGFAVVAARALIAMRRLDEARRLLEHWRALAQQVVDWQTETEAYASANIHTESVTIASDHRPSMYRAAAREIVQSADQALNEVDRLSGIPRRQAPLPSPSPA
jgi:uncharacterized protein (UPF0335 family)